jgi:hypothetical protein
VAGPSAKQEAKRSGRTARPTEIRKKSIFETLSPDAAQIDAARQWRGGCSEKLDIYIRYSQRDEWVDGGLMPGTPAAGEPDSGTPAARKLIA